MARAEAPMGGRARERDDHADGDRDPGLPAPDRPLRRPPEARVERQQVLEDDLAPRAERAARGDPDRRQHRHDERRERENGEGDPHRAAAPPRDDRDERQQARGEQRGVRLHHDPGAEREPAPEQAPLRAGLGPARDTDRAEQQERHEEEVALARLPRAARDVVAREEERGARRRDAPPRPDERCDAQRDGQEPEEVERAPAGVRRAEHGQHDEVDQVHAREVHVEQVPVRRGALADPPGEVLHDRRVVHERPGARAPDEPRGQRRERREQEPASGRSTLQ